jgi:hypothetical protein
MKFKHHVERKILLKTEKGSHGSSGRQPYMEWKAMRQGTQVPMGFRQNAATAATSQKPHAIK